MLPPRQAVFGALVEQLAGELEAVETMARLAADEVTSDESRSEGKYDTRSIEASYLARGQAERVAGLRAGLSAAQALSERPVLDRVGVGSLAQVELEDGDSLCVLFAAIGGGTRLSVGGVDVRVITPSSPLGRALLGAQVDDDVQVEVGTTERTYVVVQIG